MLIIYNYSIRFFRSSAWCRCFSSVSRFCLSAWKRTRTCGYRSCAISRSTGLNRSCRRTASVSSWTFISSSGNSIPTGTVTGRPAGRWTRLEPNRIKPSSSLSWWVDRSSSNRTIPSYRSLWPSFRPFCIFHHLLWQEMCWSVNKSIEMIKILVSSSIHPGV